MLVLPCPSRRTLCAPLQLSPPALQPPGAVCSCLEGQTVPATLAATQGAWPGHCVALGCCHRANVPLESWPGQVATSCPHLSIFRSKMLFSCEKENGGGGRGSWAAAIGQLLPQAVPVQLQPRGPDASRSHHWDHPNPIPLGASADFKDHTMSLPTWGQQAQGWPRDPQCRVPPSHPAPHPIQCPQTPAELCTPLWRLRGLAGASVPWAPAPRRQQLFLAQCFEIFYFEQQS